MLLSLLLGATVGKGIVDSIMGAQSQKQSLAIQEQTLDLQTQEIQRQRKIEEERQRRENMEIMNSVSNLTNTAYTGASSPTLSSDKYGDLG